MIHIAENPKIVQTLKRILKEYDYLEYDENRSKGDVLSIQVTAPDTKLDFDICENVRGKLEKATNVSFFVSDSVYSEGADCAKAWSYITLRLRITSNPEQCGGRPCIRGMRIRVTDVLDLLASGLSFKEILEEMPDLNSDDIVACLKFATHKIDPPVIRPTDHPVILTALP
ncbi:hypothetical protein C6501_17015 [Candidatus Poribacteria bacterium]|nr:MAG: hypothetical protein C6501_17015 [Candidatus Poribacteria bacterium]